MRDELRAAQREFDDAVTVEAKVEASAKADDIQARIDEATRGQLTIGADVEPSYIAKGSAADLRQSYQNAQARATRIQQDYEIGLIGKDKALAEIAEINLALEKKNGDYRARRGSEYAAVNRQDSTMKTFFRLLVATMP